MDGRAPSSARTERAHRGLAAAHPGALAAFVVLLVVGIGGLLRGMDASADVAPAVPAGLRVLGVSEVAAATVEVVVAPGMNHEETLDAIGAAGVDRDAFATLLAERSGVGLEGPWRSVDVRLMLHPGEYLLRSSDPEPLLAAMLDRAMRAVDDEIWAEAEARGMALDELLRRAAGVQGATEEIAEMPVVAEAMGDDRRADSTLAAPTADALRAVLWPTALADAGARLPDQEVPAHLRPAPPPRSEPPTVFDDLASLLSRESAGVGRIAFAAGRSGFVDTGVDSDTFFVTGGLEALAVVVAVEPIIDDGLVDPRTPLQVPEEVMGAEMPAARDVLRGGDLRAGLDLVIDSGSNAAIAAIVDAVGVDAIERELRDVGVRSTSLRSRPMVTTATDTIVLAQRLGAMVDASGQSLLDRFLSRRSERWMAGPYVQRAGVRSFSVERPGSLHEVARFDDLPGLPVLVQLSDGGSGARQVAARAAHVVALHSRLYVPDGDIDEIECRLSSTTDGPLRGFTVGLDPGHGGRDPGTVHEFPDGDLLRESSVTLDLARTVGGRLNALGADVVLTRCADAETSLGRRAAILNRAGVDIAVSLHADHAFEPALNTPVVIRYAEDSAGLASAISGDEDHGLPPVLEGTNDIQQVRLRVEPLATLVLTLPPVVLAEVASMSHPAEAAALRAGLGGGGGRIADIAGGIVDGVVVALSAG